MTDDEHHRLLEALGAIHRDLTRAERRLADLPGRTDRFDESLHRARWERPPPRRDLDNRLAALDHHIARIERRDDHEGPLT
ncbi:MAG: hypothetical protein H6701_03015 [Myxococcales bacterium]|nr:hypothetical protein [Myxococcales bacterium]